MYHLFNMNANLTPFVLTYWGRRGGGFRFFKETIGDLLEELSTASILVSLRSEVFSDLPDSFQARLINFDPKLSWHSNLPLSFSKSRQSRLRAFMLEQSATSIVVLMSHPSDCRIPSVFPSEFQLLRVVHDLRRHKGDIWPNPWAIKLILKAEKIVTLSDHIYNQLKVENKYRASLIRKQKPKVSQIVENLPDSYFLIIGRLKRYKNLQGIKGLSIPPVYGEIVVAGKGADRYSTKTNSVISIDRWLSDGEMEYLIKNSSGVLLIHSEASQSGILEQANFWGVPAVVTRVGALEEQLKKRGKGIAIEYPFTEQKLKEAILSVVDKCYEETPSQELIQDISMSNFLIDHFRLS
jgi:glycosyltransferase involved in cell wall biosynthesis